MPVKLSATGTGSVTLTSVANPGADYTATFPAATGSVVLSNTSGTATVTDFYATNVYASGTVQMGSSFKRNRIINGNMTIDQRNAGASVTPTVDQTYIVDRWQALLSQASKFSVQRQTSVVPTGFTYATKITSLAATSLGATDYFCYAQPIEGFNVADFSWGTANAQTVTLSFWVYSSLTGTFGGCISNSAQNRAYPFTYTISAANTWTYITKTIAGDTTGTWATDNTRSIWLMIGLGVGTTYSGTAGSWTAGTYLGATGATSVVGVNAATFYITGVQLEVGSVATPYERQIYSDQLAQCQRYYYRNNNNGQTYAGFGIGRAYSATEGTAAVYMPVPMRAAPTIGKSAFTGSNWDYGITAINIQAVTGDYRVVNCYSSGSFTSGGAYNLSCGNTTSYVYIDFSAEL